MTVVLSNKLDAANGFTTGPLPNGIEALFSERNVTHLRGFGFSHERNVFKLSKRLKIS
jgi:hypothetical protein